MQTAAMTLSMKPFSPCSARAPRNVAQFNRIMPLRQRQRPCKLVTQARRGHQEAAVEVDPPQQAPGGRRGQIALHIVSGTNALCNTRRPSHSLADIITGGVWRSVTSKNKRDQAVSGKARILESISDKRVADLFTRVDVNGDGRVDLRELTEALYKLQPNAPLSAARDSALDIFLLFDKDRNDQTLNRDEFGQFLETWCLQTGTELGEISSRIGEPREIEQAESPEDQRIEQEVTRAAEKPEDLSRVLERRKLDAVFRLWAERRGEGGRVERKDLSRALNRLLDSAGGDGADRARALVTSPTGEAQHAGYAAHLNRAEFTDLVRRVSDVAGMKHAEVLDFLIMIPLYGEERKALPPGRTDGQRTDSGARSLLNVLLPLTALQLGKKRDEDSRASAVSELHQAKEQASAVNRRRKAINILAEARKDAQQQSEARKREEAERERARKEREGQGQAQGQGQGGRASSGNGQAGGGGSAFRGTTASEAGIQDAASDQSKGSSTARS